MAEAKPFRVVSDEIDPADGVAEKVGIQTLMLGLAALSQRTLVALSRLFTLLTVASVFWLFLSIPSPSPWQLAELAMYGLFVLAANFIVRRA